MSYPDNNDRLDSFEMSTSSRSFTTNTSEPSVASRRRIRRPQNPVNTSLAASPAANPRLRRNQPQTPEITKRDDEPVYDDVTDDVIEDTFGPQQAFIEPDEEEEFAGEAPEPKQKRAKSRTSEARKVQSQPKEPRELPFAAFFADGRLSIFFGILILIVAAYMLITSISYLSSGAADQNLVENNTLSELSERADAVSNTGGPFGAMLSYMLISRWLGLGSFVVIFYLIILSISLLRLHKCHFWSLTLKSLFTAIAASILIGGATYSTASPTFWGGEHGYFVNHFMLTNTGIWGDLALNIMLLATVALIFFDTLKKLFTIIYEYIQQYKSTLERHRSASRAMNHYEEDEYSDDDMDEQPVATATQQNSKTKPSFANVLKIIKRAEEAEVSEQEQEPIEPAKPETAPADVVPAAEEKSADSAPEASATEAEMEINVADIDKADKIATDSYDPTAELSRYRLPSIDLLKIVAQRSHSIDQEEQEMNKERITRTLNSYGIEISRITATVGPTITLYEIIPAEGIRIAKIERLGDDMAMSLSALGIRIIAPMPGKGTIGMEVPNREKQVVSIRDILSSKAYQESKADLPMALGSTIDNQVFIEDLCKMPHLLVAGATGMGKSVGLNTIIASLLYKKHPAELKFVLIDPKEVEFSLYNCLERHFLAKLPDEEDAIITEPSKVVATLNSLCVEMDNRYKILKNAGVRDIKSYNAKFVSRHLNPEKGHRFLPYIVVIVDEFADLIMTAGKEVEQPIARIAQKARAVGIHLILATQRPSVNVITGIIKANFPGRIAFRVMQTVDSRTILDRPGAEQLIGRGDMLFSTGGIINRVQCALIETEEVERVCEYISEQIGYSTAYELPEYIPATEGRSGGGSSSGERDPLFEEAGRFIISSGIGSTTSIQRHFNVGYPRAGKLMDQLQDAGVVGPSQGGKPRNVLMDMATFEQSLTM